MTFELSESQLAAVNAARGSLGADEIGAGELANTGISTTIPSDAFTDANTPTIGTAQTNAEDIGSALASPTPILANSVPSQELTDLSIQLAGGGEDTFDTVQEEIQTGRTSFMDKVKGMLGIGEEEDTMSEFADGILPEIPEALTKLDTQLGDLQTAFERESVGIQDQAGRGLRFIEGDQQRLNREFELQEAKLLRRRDAISGDFERATERAKDIIELEREDRKIERDRQLSLIELMRSELEGEEALLLAQFENKLRQDEIADDRKYEKAQNEADGINKVITSDPEAFQSYFARGGEYPTTVAEAVRILAKNSFADAQGDASLSILDIKRYQEVYNVTFPAGATAAEANALIAQTTGMTTKDRQTVVNNFYTGGVDGTSQDATPSPSQTNITDIGTFSGITGTPIPALQGGGMEEQIAFAKSQGYSDDEIAAFFKSQ